MNDSGLTHFDEQGQAIMVDVSGKTETHRTAVASGLIKVRHSPVPSPAAF